MKHTLIALFAYLVLDAGFEIAFSNLIYSYSAYLGLCGLIYHGTIRNQLPLTGMIVETLLIAYHLLKLSYRSIVIDDMAFVGGFLVASSIWYLMEQLFPAQRSASSSDLKADLKQKITDLFSSGGLDSVAPKNESDDEHLDAMLNRVNKRSDPPLSNEQKQMLDDLTKNIVQNMAQMGINPI